LTEITIKGRHIVTFFLLIIVILSLFVIIKNIDFISKIKSSLQRDQIEEEPKQERILPKAYRDYNVTFRIPISQIDLDFRETRKSISKESIEYLQPNNEYIKDLANQLKDEAERQGNDTALYVIRFVQDLPYEKDLKNTIGWDEYPKYPTETLYEGMGDCEDQSYLLYSLLEALGYDVMFILIPGHAVVGIRCTDCDGDCMETILTEKSSGRQYYLTETTARKDVGCLSNQFKREIVDYFKTNNTKSTKSINCFYEEIPYEVEVEYEEEVPYTINVPYEVDVPETKEVPFEKAVSLSYDVRNKKTNKLSFWECTFDLGMGANCYEAYFSIRNEDNEGGNFKYSYNLIGNKGSSKRGSGELYINGYSIKQSPRLLINTDGSEIVSIEVTVIPPEKKVIDYKEETEWKKETRVREETEYRTETKKKIVTKYELKYRCVDVS